MVWSSTDKILLCTFSNHYDNGSETDCQYINSLREGDWISVIKGPILEVLLSGDVNASTVTSYLQKYDSQEKKYEVLAAGIAALLLFCELNWSGPMEEFNFEELNITWPAQVNALARLELDFEEIDINVKSPEILLIALEIITGVKDYDASLLTLWWTMRCKYIHQMIVEETSSTLFDELEGIITNILHLNSEVHETKFDVLLNVEIAYVYLHYGHVFKADQHLTRAEEISGLTLTLKGQLGYRTKFQETPKAQLALQIITDKERSAKLGETPCDTLLPAEVEVEDDVRLSKIKYVGIDEAAPEVLTSLEQAICCLTLRFLYRSQPKDELINEQLRPYIIILLKQETGPWAVRVAILLTKIKLGAKHRRSVETSLQQCEALVANWSKTVQDHDASKRLGYLWSSGLPPVWKWRHQLADLHISLGLVKAALEEYLKLKMWEDVIVCYTILQLRHKAAEVIQQQIDIKPSVKLYCLLGDATDDISCFEKAWEMSNHRSGRAQRHWGNFLFSNKQYLECIPHYQASLSINSLQDSVWLRLGYAALTSEKWEIAADAYRRYTIMEPGSFEAWNNLAKVYVKQDDKERAYKALMEATKFSYDNWQVWENVVAVSIDTGHYDDVIRGYHRLLDLKGKHLDFEVLCLLVKGLLQSATDSDCDSSSRLNKNVSQLFGRLTSIYPSDPELWQLYADITVNDLQRGQRLLRVYRGIHNHSDWSKDPQFCEKVVKYAISLGETTVAAANKSEEVERLQLNELLSSTRLYLKGVISSAEAQKWPHLDSEVQIMKNLLEEITDKLTKSINVQ